MQPPQIIISFRALKQCIEKAAIYYRTHDDDSALTGDRNGQWHGRKGKVRAEKVLGYAQNITADDGEALLALMVAIYKPHCGGFFDVSPGRSSRLAGLIADHMIKGDGEAKSKLDSKIFQFKALNNTRESISNMRVAGKILYYDRTKGVRSLIRLALLCEEKEVRERICDTAKRLENFLDNSKFEKIDLSLLTSHEIEMEVLPLLSREFKR